MAGGYVVADLDNDRFELPAEYAAVLADDKSPLFMAPAFAAAGSLYLDVICGIACRSRRFHAAAAALAEIARAGRGMIIMLASDICRTIVRHQPSPLLSQLQQWSAASAEIVISSITYAELVAAALLTTEQERHMSLVEEFCARLDAIVSWDSAAVDAYTTLQRSLMQEQRVLNMNDVMIAAHAISLNAALLSNSERAFSGLPQLHLQLWNGAGQ